MIITPALPNGFTIFSDDVRHEINGKISYIGVYRGQMTIGHAGPVQIPQLCISIFLRIAPDSLPENFHFRAVRYVEDEEKEELARIDFDTRSAEIQRLPIGSPVNFVEVGGEVRISPFIVSQNCKIGARCYIGGDEIRLGALIVELSSPTLEKEQ